MSFNPDSYKPVTDDNLNLYNKHKEKVEEEIRSKHSVPDDFQLVPVTYSARPMCGLDLTYKVGLPNGQFVKVRFMAGGIVQPGESGPKVSFYVSDTLSSSANDDD